MPYTAKRVVSLGTALFSLCVVVLLSGCDSREPEAAAELLREPYVSHVDGAEREYFVYLPKGYAQQPERKWPLLFFLHGNGERGNGKDELDYVLIHGPLYEAWAQKRDLPFIIVAPQLHMFGMDEKWDYIANRTRDQIPVRSETSVPPREYFQPEGEMLAGEQVTEWQDVPPLLPDGWERVEQDLLDILDTVTESKRVDTTRVYLTGISYGGFGTWYMASKHPHQFAAIAPVVGWGHPDMMAPIAEANLPVWAFAGGRDDAVKKPYFYTGLNVLEKNSNAEVRFTVHEDMSHDVWRRVYEGEDIYAWLLQHRRTPH